MSTCHEFKGGQLKYLKISKPGWELFPVLLLTIGSLIFVRCSPNQLVTASPSVKLSVVATTTILGNVVKEIGGDQIDLTILLPTGVDPHSYQPTPQDIKLLTNSNLIFMNGAGLEEFMQRLIDNALIGANHSSPKIISASDGINLRHLDSAQGQSGIDTQGGTDPHVWFDPQNVIIWSQNIAETLSNADPANASLYQENQKAYQTKLEELDQWITQQIAQIPAQDRKLVTDHNDLGYFADKYGFDILGAVVPSFSTAAEPSAQELANLEQTIQDSGAKAVVVGTTVNANIEKRIAQDTNTKLITIYTGSLSEPGGEAATYLDFMRYDATAIVTGLK